jgi:hypothetical protein
MSRFVLMSLYVAWLLAVLAIQAQMNDGLALLTALSLVTAYSVWALKPMPRRYPDLRARLTAMALPATEWGRSVQLLIWLWLLAAFFRLFGQDLSL